jgi:uncharacterized damage-inducible protein DinB
MSTLANQFRRWFEYERDSHARVLASLDAIPESLRSSEAFDQAAGLLAHIVAARQLWLYRLGAAPQEPAEFFPKGVRLRDLEVRLKRIESAWEGYLARLDDAGLARSFEYRSQEGECYRNSIHDILTQLYGHSLYHRGQIAALVRSLGCEPAVTDFVFWTREPIAVPADLLVPSQHSPPG